MVHQKWDMHRDQAVLFCHCEMLPPFSLRWQHNEHAEKTVLYVETIGHCDYIFLSVQVTLGQFYYLVWKNGFPWRMETYAIGLSFVMASVANGKFMNLSNVQHNCMVGVKVMLCTNTNLHSRWWTSIICVKKKKITSKAANVKSKTFTFNDC